MENEYYLNENGDIIITKWETEFERGFIPKKDQKIFMQCPECKMLHQIQLGRGKITDVNYCNCGYCFEYDTFDMFECTDVYFVYSDKKYVSPFMYKHTTDLNSNVKLTMAVSKVVGEAFFETILKYKESDTDGHRIIDLNEFIKENLEDEDCIVLVNSQDSHILLNIGFHNNIEKVYVIDDNYKVSKLLKVIANVTIEIEDN